MRSFTVRGSESPGSKASVVRSSREGGEPIDEIVESGRSPLDSIVRDGARRMLQAALESEVDAFLEEHAVLLDECGRRRVVRNGYLPTREIATGAGILEVSQPRVRDKASIVDERIVFSSKILPPYLRKSRSMEDLIPWLYLKGVSTGDFGEALESLIGPSAKGFSPNVIVRLKERWSGEYDEWSRRDLTGKQYVYVWADGIHVRIRLEDPANPKQCLLVVMGATADGQKELIAVIDGVRESKQSWLELLLDLKNRGLTIPPTIAVADGALGFWAALREAYPTTREQRCSKSTRPPTSSTPCPRRFNRKRSSTSTRSGSPRPGRWPIRPSITSWRNTAPSTRLHAPPWPRDSGLTNTTFENSSPMAESAYPVSRYGTPTRPGRPPQILLRRLESTLAGGFRRPADRMILR